MGTLTVLNTKIELVLAAIEPLLQAGGVDGTPTAITSAPKLHRQECRLSRPRAAADPCAGNIQAARRATARRRRLATALCSTTEESRSGCEARGPRILPTLA